MGDDKHNTDLETYLRDHYAGGIGALELLDHLIKTHQTDDLGRLFLQLRSEIQSDHEQLHELMVSLGFEKGMLRNTGAWVAEKIARAKVGFTASAGSRLRLLQSLETLLLGITGKTLLWRALMEAQDFSSILKRTDLERLESRAVAQAERVERQRLLTVQGTFCTALCSDRNML